MASPKHMLRNYNLKALDQIILQHHVKKDGSGFPRSLAANRIMHLSTLFIMVEDLVNFISRGAHLETSIKDYLVWSEYDYDQGNFKKSSTSLS
jgi:response regulator RpfG family c-di-GMP phosphodiesterase